MKYWVQSQTQAGTYADELGTNSIETARSHAEFRSRTGFNVRIVERVDTVIETFTSEAA